MELFQSFYLKLENYWTNFDFIIENFPTFISFQGLLPRFPKIFVEFITYRQFSAPLPKGSFCLSVLLSWNQWAGLDELNFDKITKIISYFSWKFNEILERIIHKSFVLSRISDWNIKSTTENFIHVSGGAAYCTTRMIAQENR